MTFKIPKKVNQKVISVHDTDFDILFITFVQRNIKDSPYEAISSHLDTRCTMIGCSNATYISHNDDL